MADTTTPSQSTGGEHYPGKSVQPAQDVHRKNLIDIWSIPVGSKILELGCGQGDCTAELARTVGKEGHVDAIDPASPDYGSPETLGQAQARLSRTEIGPQISWHQASPVDFLASSKAGKYDTAILCHCIWYFDSSAELSNVLRALRGKTDRLCIAEWSMSATAPEAVPHVLSALARASLEAHRPDSAQNIRTALAPEGIRAIAQDAGWKLVNEKMITPDAALQDGGWETGTVVKETFLTEIEQGVKEDRIKVALKSMRVAAIEAVKKLGGAKVQAMDAWVAVFE